MFPVWSSKVFDDFSKPESIKIMQFILYIQFMYMFMLLFFFELFFSATTKRHVFMLTQQLTGHKFILPPAVGILRWWKSRGDGRSVGSTNRWSSTNLLGSSDTWLMIMVIVSALSRVGPLPNGLNGFWIEVTNYLLSGMILQVGGKSSPTSF